MLPWRNQNLNARQSPVDVPKVLDITGMRGEISCAFLTWRNLNLSLGGSFKKQLHGYIHLILLNISDLVSSSKLTLYLAITLDMHERV
ncbi:hypothetical protein MIMGU_mgv1a017239mg [Erythranthe guttata]|uniref:Uncharacterized protein n=1 Tax=Erythranthe guttata TaxID=4155 RepID=A0A022QTD4_ERYGU|nr:hypothetical protein MIMGU_mgv1a017239mg [Erythranthe guttata]